MQVHKFDLFEIHQIRGHIQEIYLVVYANKILLLDGTSKPDVDLVANYIKNTLERDISQVLLCVVTHMHPDHAGGARHYRRRFGIPILSSAYADRWYSGFSGAIQHALDTIMGQFVARQGKAGLKSMWYKRSIKPDYIAEDGAELIHFADWQTICTPGHTDHDISLYHPGLGIMYVGDLVLRIRSKFLLPFPINLPQTIKQSLCKLRKFDIKHLLMAHGGWHNVLSQELLIDNLQNLIGKKLNKQFRILSVFVGINNSLKRGKQRLDSLQNQNNEPKK